MLLVMMKPFSRSMARPGGPVDSGAVAAQATHIDWEHPERMPEGEPDCGAAGIAVFSLALLISLWLKSVAVIKNVPAGGLVEDAIHVGPPF